MLHIEVDAAPPASATAHPAAYYSSPPSFVHYASPSQLLLLSRAPELSASSSSGIMLLHSHCCFCSGLQVASSKQQQHAAHRGRSSIASGSHRSGHSPPSPGGCKSAVPAQWPSCSPAAHVIQDTWEDHRWACHRLSALWGAETSPSYTCRCSLGCRGTTLMFL